MTKNKGGRPLKFQSVEELQTKIDDYFDTTPKDEYTITGLAMHLDTFRSVLCDYESGKYDYKEFNGHDMTEFCESSGIDKDEWDETLKRERGFSNAIKKGKQRVENGYELDLKKKGHSGSIFALKNFNWKDKIEQDTTLKNPKGESFKTEDISEMKPEARKEYLKSLIQ